MFCRRAWQRVGPLAWSSFRLPCRRAPVRPLSSRVPGGSSNMTYFILCGGGLTAAVIYAYKTVNGDTERYEDRLANMGASAKAAAPTGATAAEEVAPIVEVISESIFIPAEPVAETDAELVVETLAEEAADVVSELHVDEATTEPAAAEEAVPPVAVGEAEAAPVAVAAETPAEAPAAQSTGSVADLLTAVKVLSGSTVEIAAASVGEKSLVNAVQQIQEDGKALSSTEEAGKPEILVADLLAETATVVNEEEAKSAEAGAADDEEEVMAEETSASAIEEDEAALSSHEQSTASTKAVEEVVEDQAPNPDTPPKEAFFYTGASPEDASPAEQVTLAAGAPPTDDADASVEAAAAAPGEEATGAASTQSESAAAAHMTQLAAASTASELDVLSAGQPESDAPSQEAKHCHSCHSAPSAVEEDVGEELISERAGDATHEVKEEASLVTKTSENMVVTPES